MNTNHAKAIKGMSIANIVLGILVILGSMGGCAALGVGGAAMAGSGYSYIPLDDGTYLDVAALGSVLGVMSVFMVLATICGVLVLIAGIMGVRGADKPEKLKGVMIWNIVGAIASFCGAGIISLVLCVIVAVFASKDKNAFATASYAAPAPYGAPVYGAPAVPPAPATPQQPTTVPVATPIAAAEPAAPAAAALVSDPAPVTPTAAVATEAVVAEASTDPTPAEVAAVEEQADSAAAAQAEPAILLPDNYIEDAQAGVTVVEETPAEGADAPSEPKEN